MKSPFKVMSTAALAAAVAVPTLSAPVADAAETSSFHSVALETEDGSVVTVPFTDYAQAKTFGTGDLGEFVASADVVAVSAEEGQFVTIRTLAMAKIENPDADTVTLLDELDNEEDNLVSDDEVADYTDWEDLGEDAEAAVESVSANNLKEVTVEFSNTGYDLEEAKDSSNYSVVDADGNTHTVTEVEVEGTEAVLTLADGDEGANQLDATLTVEKVVTGSEEDVEQEFTFFDATIPEAKSVQLIGPNKIKAVFSEPIQTTAQTEVEVENGIYGVSEVTTDGNEAVITLSASSLSEDEYSVKLSGFEDYAGYEALTKEFTLDYAKDTEAPSASIKSSSQTQVVVEFSEPVVDEDGDPLSKEYFYHSYTSYMPNADGSVPAVQASADGTEYTLNFTDNPLPEGDVKFFVNYDANDSVVQDEWGNELDENITLDVNVEADETKPEVTEVSVEDEKNIRVYFSEDVNKDDAEDKDNFTFENSDGDEVTPSDINYTVNSSDEEYYAEATFSSDLKGNYTVTVEDIEDKALVPNKLQDVTEAFEVSDLTGPDLDDTADTTKVVGVPGDSSNPSSIYVYYPEKMATSGEYSVLDKGNYQLNGSDLAAKDNVQLFKDSSAVKITVADGTTSLNNLTIGRVADAAGNPSEDLSVTENIQADDSPEITGVSQIDEQTVEITVDKPLKTVVASGFTVTSNGVTKELASVDWDINDSNETVITGTLKAENQLGEDDTDQEVTTVSAVDSENVSETGKEMAAFTYGNDAGETIEDAFNPHLLANGVTQSDNQEVTLSFSEGLSLVDPGLAASDLVITDEDGDTLNPGTDYSVALDSDNSKLVVTLKGSTYGTYTGELEVATDDEVTYITDASANSNALEAFSAKEVTLTAMDTTNPSATTLTETSDNSDSSLATTGDTVTISFDADEAVTISSESVEVDGVAGASTVNVTDAGDSDDSTWNLEYTVDSADANNGDVTFSFVATDSSNNTATFADGDITDSSSVSVDQTFAGASTTNASTGTSTTETIEVEYDEVVEQSTAENINNYSFNDNTSSGADTAPSITGASLNANGTTLTLTVDASSGDAIDPANDTLDITGVEDQAGNASSITGLSLN